MFYILSTIALFIALFVGLYLTLYINKRLDD